MQPSTGQARDALVALGADGTVDAAAGRAPGLRLGEGRLDLVEVDRVRLQVHAVGRGCRERVGRLASEDLGLVDHRQAVVPVVERRDR